MRRNRDGGVKLNNEPVALPFLQDSGDPRAGDVDRLPLGGQIPVRDLREPGHIPGRPDFHHLILDRQLGVLERRKLLL